MTTRLKLEKAPFATVRRVLEKHLPGFDMDVVEAILATIVSNKLDGPPNWLMLIAPPSSGKTVVLEPLAGIKGGTIISEITSHTLISGARVAGGRDPSLLRRLGSKPFLVIKDLGTLLADPHGRGEIFAQLREVYDGYISKSFGTGDRRSWQGKATVIAAMTPAVDTFSSLDAHLGERFLKLRFRSNEDPVELAKTAWLSTGSEKTARQQLHKAYKTAIKGAAARLSAVSLGPDTIDQIANLAALLAEVRTPVCRNEYRSDRVELPPTTEGTPRTMKMLGLFATGLAALRGQNDLSDFGLLFRLTLDAMPEPRRSLFLEVARHQMEEHAPAIDEMELTVSSAYALQVLGDLEAAGVIQSGKRASGPAGGRPAKTWSLSERTHSRMEDSGLAEFLNSNT